MLCLQVFALRQQCPGFELSSASFCTIPCSMPSWYTCLLEEQYEALKVKLHAYGPETACLKPPKLFSMPLGAISALWQHLCEPLWKAFSASENCLFHAFDSSRLLSSRRDGSSSTTSPLTRRIPVLLLVAALCPTHSSSCGSRLRTRPASTGRSSR